MYDEQKRKKAAALHVRKCSGLAIGFKAVEAAPSHRPAGFAGRGEDAYDC